MSTIWPVKRPIVELRRWWVPRGSSLEIGHGTDRGYTWRDVELPRSGSPLGGTLIGTLSEQTSDRWELLQVKGMRHHSIALKTMP